MAFTSQNMNYIFNVEYFKDIFQQTDPVKVLKGRNEEMFHFRFEGENSPLSVCRTMDGYGEFALYTLYPGLLVGTGNPHDIAMEGALKCGFTFDYVTGLPYITGSTLKGMLRSYFPGERKNASEDKEYQDMIKGLLGREDVDVPGLKDHMVENNDIFLGAYPVTEGQDKTLLEMEFVTPHKVRFMNPNPISMVKVKPAVKFVFSMVLSDYCKDGEVHVSKEEKLMLCKELILLLGIGAKTNVGFGRFAERKPIAHATIPREERGGREHKVERERKAKIEKQKGRV